MRAKPAQAPGPAQPDGQHRRRADPAAAVEAAVAVLASNETAANPAEVALRVARQVEADTRQAHDEARRNAERLQTEVRTLTDLLKVADNDLWPALVDQIKVESGYETALGAALGDDIDASADEAAPVHWRGLPPSEDGISLPAEAQPLVQFCRGATGTCAKAFTDWCSVAVAWPGASGAIAIRAAARVARRRCLALGWIYIGC